MARGCDGPSGSLRRLASSRGAVGALVGAALLAPAAARAEVAEAIVAVVNDDVILLSQLEERAEPVIAQAAQGSLGSEVSAGESMRIRRRVLAEMIDEALIAEQASKMRIRVSSEEVDRALKNMARQNGLSWPDFLAAIEKQGYGISRYRTELRRQLERFKVVQTKLQGRLRVSDRAIEAYYAQEARQAREGDRARVAHILVEVAPDAGAATLAQKRRRAEAILERAEAGAPFAALAERYSEDSATKARGGSLGWVTASDLPEALGDEVLGLNAGAVGGPVRTDEGFHVVKVLAWEASEVRPLEDVRERIRLHLLEQQMEQQERIWLAELRRRAYIDVRLRQ